MRTSTQDNYPITTSNYQHYKPAACDVGTTTEDLTQESMTPQFAVPQCRLWDYGMELEVGEGLCNCTRCERETVSKTEAEISRIRIRYDLILSVEVLFEVWSEMKLNLLVKLKSDNNISYNMTYISISKV